MKKMMFICLFIATALTLSGCNIWLDGEYHSVTPHLNQTVDRTNTDWEVTSFAELRDKLTENVADGIENGVIYYPAVEKNVLNGFMNSAIDYVMRSTPVGAYAVSEISYETGTNAGKQAIAFTVTYRHNRSEILRIRQTENMDEVKNVIASALKSCDAEVTIQVARYDSLDILQYVQDFVDENPDVCMEMPQVTASVYPEQGTSRILEIRFAYQNSRDDLRKMQQMVEPIFDSAELYVSGDGENMEKFFQLYSFLMERHDYELKTAITPAYHLLRHGVGDCKSFAAVYAAMCRRAGLYCQIVTGTRAGESWHWNVIMEEGQFYYIDLLKCNESGRFTVKTQEEMSGYVWDYDLFATEVAPETT